MFGDASYGSNTGIVKIHEDLLEDAVVLCFSEQSELRRCLFVVALVIYG